jgi:hypothetical protein
MIVRNSSRKKENCGFTVSGYVEFRKCGLELTRNFGFNMFDG